MKREKKENETRDWKGSMRGRERRERGRIRLKQKIIHEYIGFLIDSEPMVEKNLL